MAQNIFRPFEILKLIRDKKITNTRDLLTIPYSLFGHQVREFLNGLEELGFIEIGKKREVKTTELFSKFVSALDLSLTQLRDYSRDSIVCTPLFELPTEPSVKTEVFVVMPFRADLKPVYEDHIRNVSQKLNLATSRGDDFFTASSIISDIWNAIYSCQIVIADCTGRNPNVFYEIGVAHTLGKPVIFISQNKDYIPFDIQHIRYILYEFTPRGMKEFEKNLITTIEHQLRANKLNSLEKMIADFKDENG